MKKNIIALAIASAVAAPVAFADAPTVYGKVNMALQQTDADVAGVAVQNDGTTVDDVASRLGIKGSEDLGNGLKAIYKIEFSVPVGSSSTIGNRNQYVGLAGGFGTVLMGRHDTPTKMIQAKDLFNDGVADNKPMAGGLGAFGKGMENRVNNVLAYVSPSFSGVKLIAAFVPKETGGDATEESTVTDLMSFGLTYGSAKKGLYLAAGMDMASDNFTGADVNADGDTDNAEHTRLVAQYATGGLIANVMYQGFAGEALEDTVNGGTNIQANIGYKMGKFTPKFKVSMVDIDNGATTDFDTTDDGSAPNVRITDESSTNYAVGLDYALGKKTTSYVTYTAIENAGGVDKSDANVISVGLLHKF
jgi:predicted porin